MDMSHNLQKGNFRRNWYQAQKGGPGQGGKQGGSAISSFWSWCGVGVYCKGTNNKKKRRGHKGKEARRENEKTNKAKKESRQNVTLKKLNLYRKGERIRKGSI